MTSTFALFFSISLAWAVPQSFQRLDQANGGTINPWAALNTSKTPVVLVFISAKCPCSQAHQPVLKELASQYQGKVSFLGVVSNEEPEALAHFQAASLGFPVIADHNHFLADKYGARATPHAFVIREGALLYQGGIDSSHDPKTAKEHYLRTILAVLDRNETLPFSEKRSLGCLIRR